MGLFGRCGHVFKGLDSSQPHYFGLDRAIRNVSSVTGACLLIRADVFREAGGFDEDNFPVNGNDLIARGVTPGPAVGEALRQLEDWWIASDFKPAKDELLGRLGAIMS